MAPPTKAAPPAARAAGAAPVAEPAETAAPAPVPLADMPAAPPAVAAPPVQQTPVNSSRMLPMAGAMALALFALIGLAMALRRRKLRREEEFAAAEQYEAENEAPAQADPLFVEQPSAPFATGVELAPEGPCTDAAPGSHVEAACEGPTEDNPSLSIKKRLKRAQFFDQREQLAAAGMAVPVAPDAGLPDSVVVTAPAPSTREPA